LPEPAFGGCAEGSQLEKLPALLKHLRNDHPITLVYIEAGEDALLNGATAKRGGRIRLAGPSVREVYCTNVT